MRILLSKRPAREIKRLEKELADVDVHIEKKGDIHAIWR